MGMKIRIVEPRMGMRIRIVEPTLVKNGNEYWNNRSYIH